MDTQELVLQKWTALEKRWLNINGDVIAKALREGDMESLKLIKYGLAIPLVYKLKGFDNAWEVYYAGIKITYMGWGAEGKARAFANTLKQEDPLNPINDENLAAAQAFVRSCENWHEYASADNIDVLVKALMLVRPLSVNKIWSVFRLLIDNGDIKPIGPRDYDD